MNEEIKWTLKQVPAKDIKPNPDNPKVRDDKGFKRLQKSLSKFGKVFDGICNADLTLIDGHSRFELNKSEVLNVFVPSRQLTPDEYRQMNAMFDVAKAGDIDWGIIENWETHILSEWDIDEVESLEGEKKIIKETEIVPFKKTHILLSFDPEKIALIQKHIEDILKIEGIEYEQSSN